MKLFFTWWNKQTVGTLLKTFFTGTLVGEDDFGNKYYKNKKNERWVIYSQEVEATKISSEWYLWIHHTTDILPEKSEKKFNWQKKHLENQTGTKNKHNPAKITKSLIRKKYETWK
tara:strand:+ start:112 stop:456 length:345 start_codon:yes stop_codon:yes gene_type:complete